MSLLQETQIGRLGSRFSLNFRPREQRVYTSPLGRFYDAPVELGIGLKLDGELHILPFASGTEFHHFKQVEEELLMEGVQFKVRDAALGVEFTCKIHAPFYPGDRKIAMAPFFYIDLSLCSFLHGRKSFKPFEGEWFLYLGGLAQATVAGDSLQAQVPEMLDKDCWYYTSERPEWAQSPFSEATYNGELKISPLLPDSWNTSQIGNGIGLQRKFILNSSQQIVNETLIMAAYQTGSVFKVKQQECTFLYTSYFADLDSVVDYAREERERLLTKTALFTSTVAASSLGYAAKSVLACGFQNYLVNSWWVNSPEGKDWFVSWEGWCAFHSTLDVEYNSAWFAILYWPELLEKQLKDWYENLQTRDYPSHDLGILLEMNQQVYPHDMQVEESCNLILLTYAMFKLRNDQTWRSFVPELLKTVRYLLTSDTTGNGYPNLGVANTVDDAAATVQYAREQTYLAVKTLSALTAFLEMFKNESQTADCLKLFGEAMEMIARIKATMDTEAWLDDHYSVCLPQSAEGLRDVWTGHALGTGNLHGWDAYSLYTSNGLLWLLTTGVKPNLDYFRLKLDLEKALEKSLTSFGCTHSSFDRSNVWLSQNIWRDQCAAYLGINLNSMMELYWNFLEWENTQGRGGCYVDTYGWNWLSYYPRGITAIGILASQLGMKIVAEQQRLELEPVEWPCRFPLLILADWEKGIIPWFEGHVDGGVPTWSIKGELPSAWKVVVKITGGDEREEK